MPPALFIALAIAALVPAGLTAEPPRSPVTPANHPLEFIDTSFENASPLWYDFELDGTVLIHLIYDHERSSPNRAAGENQRQCFTSTSDRSNRET